MVRVEDMALGLLESSAAAAVWSKGGCAARSIDLCASVFESAGTVAVSVGAVAGRQIENPLEWKINTADYKSESGRLR